MKKFLIIPLMLALALLIACNSSTSNSPLPLAPEITAQISGNVSLDYKSAGFFLENTDSSRSGKKISLSGTMHDGLDYSIIIDFYVTDQLEPGIYHFTADPDTCSGNCIFGALNVAGGNINDLYLSVSGTVEITYYDGNILKGSFNFSAVLQGGTTVVDIKNGELDVANF